MRFFKGIHYALLISLLIWSIIGFAFAETYEKVSETEMKISDEVITTLNTEQTVSLNSLTQAIAAKKSQINNLRKDYLAERARLEVELGIDEARRKEAVKLGLEEVIAEVIVE